MKMIRRFDLFSLCRTAWLVDFCLLLVTALPVGIIAFAIRAVAGLSNPVAPLIVAIGALILHPLLAALGALLGGALYNQIAKRFGGIRIELE